MPYKNPELRREKQKGYSKNHYKKNKAKRIAQNDVFKKHNRAVWEAFKATQNCEFCGEDHPAALDFHHLPGHVKLGNVVDMISNNRLSAAFREVEKCICLCANCHRKLHHEIRQLKKLRSPKKKKGRKAPSP